MTDDTKQRLITAAGEMFAQRGFEATGIREICTQADANIAAVNYHFGDKMKLYLACLEQATSCQLEDIAAASWNADMPPEERLRAFIGGMLRSKLASNRPRWHLELMLREMVTPSPACAELVEQFIRPVAEALWTIVSEMTHPTQRDRHGWIIGFSIVGQVLFYYVHQPIIRLLMGEAEFNRLSVDELADHITRFCLAALGKGPAIDVEPLAGDVAKVGDPKGTSS